MIPRRVVSLWLPHWPLTVRAKSPGAPPNDLPFALVERGARGMVLTSVNPAARAAGLRAGQSHADAQAMVSALATEPARPAHDAAALDALAHWCLRWSPGVAVDAPDGVFVDCGGSAHLFGGEAGLLTDIAARLAAAHVPVRVAVAANPAAAWAAARFSGEAATRIDGNLRASFASYPLAALRLDGATLGAAAALGLRCVGDLYAMPRAGLARRFPGLTGLGVVDSLDRLLGSSVGALTTIEPPRRHVVRAVFAEPVTATEGVATRLPGLLDELARLLAADGLGALGLRLAGCRVDGSITAIEVRLGSARRDATLWHRLLVERGLDRLDLGFGIDALVCTATDAAPVSETTAVLGAPEAAREALPELIDRLSARLGARAVRTARVRARWLPEHAEAWVPAQGQGLDPGTTRDPADVPRPLIILDPPESIEATALVPHGAPVQFRWRRLVRRVARIEGPERLAPEWWCGAARTRDYYRVEDSDGARWWLYREGVYGADDAAPAWWLHGVFA